MEKLTEKQKRFVDFYIQTGNASEAARLAGYNSKSAGRIGGENLKKLDRYEGYPHFYYKRNIEVEMEGGKTVKGMVYIMHEERKLGLPSIHYYKILSDAYEKFDFDLKILEEALNYSEK